MKTLNIATVKAAKQAGFTIIELVVVILLLGILTATALPRFIDVTEEAHLAAVDGVLGGLGTGVALFRAQWVADNQPTTGIAEFGGLRAMTTGVPNGYPTTTTTNVNPTTHALCLDVFRNVLQAGGAPAIAASAGAIAATAGTGVGVVAASSATVDWVAMVTTAATPTCEYYYTGRAASKVAGAQVPYLIYTPSTGSIVLSAALSTAIS